MLIFQFRGNFAIREIYLSSSFLSSYLQRKQLILAISSLECSCTLHFNFLVNHHQRGKWVQGFLGCVCSWVRVSVILFLGLFVFRLL